MTDYFMLAMGTSGDIGLMRRLARELIQRGHRVRFATSPFYEGGVAAAGCEFTPVGHGTIDELMSITTNLQSVRNRHERARMFFERWIQPQLTQSWSTLTKNISTTDCFINSLKIPARDVPTVNVTYEPPERVSDVLSYATRRIPNRTHILELVALDAVFAEAVEPWDSEFHFSGFWHLPSNQWNAESLLNSESDSGGVVLTMGSMTCFDQHELAETFSEAIRRLDTTGIVIGGWSRLDDIVGGTPRVQSISEAPYDAIFRNANCVVHHGGYGAVTAVLRNGVPSIVLPQTPTQSAFAQLMQHHRLISAPLETETLTVETLVNAIREVSESSAIADAVGRWKETMDANGDGLTQAVDLIEEHLKSGVDARATND